MEPVGHAYDGRRVHAAAKGCKDAGVGTKSAADRFRKDFAEMLLILSVGVVADGFPRIEIPVPLDFDRSVTNEDAGRRWHGLDFPVRREVRSRDRSEPAGNIVLVERKLAT